MATLEVYDDDLICPAAHAVGALKTSLGGDCAVVLARLPVGTEAVFHGPAPMRRFLEQRLRAMGIRVRAAA